MMKNGIYAMLALALTSSAPLAQAQEPLLSTELLVASMEIEASALNLIDWKVGDSMNHDISMGFMGKMGTSVKNVREDTGDTIWLHQEVNMQSQNEIIEIELRKADGKVLKMTRNGQDQEIPNDKIEIISQEGTQIRVPAGTFECIHIVAKTEKVKKIEVWANPRDTSLDGTLKQAVSAPFGTLVLELTQFHRN